MTRKETLDAGLAFVLILLIIALALKSHLLVAVAALAVLVCMTVPRLFTPWAFFWFALSRVLGAVMSRVILAAIYFLVVTPVAVVRRAAGKDPMLRKRWKQADGSVFADRHHTFGPEDIEHPY
jgi:hypothetical protein